MKEKKESKSDKKREDCNDDLEKYKDDPKFRVYECSRS